MRDGKHLGKKYDPTAMTPDDYAEAVVSELALIHFNCSLEEKHAGVDDLHMIHVNNLKAALLAAFEAGKQEGQRDGINYMIEKGK